jgi:hypothetical protein
MKSPAKRGLLDGTTALESGSDRFSVTGAPLTASMAGELSLKVGVSVTTDPVAGIVAVNTAGAENVVPPITVGDGLEALMRIFPFTIEIA